MSDDIALRPIELHDGYLPIEDHGLVGDGSASALVGRDGTIVWLCIPRLDSPPVFSSLLDRNRGGHFRVRPHGLRTAGHAYIADTGVLVTEMQGDDGVVRVTDALTLLGGVDLREEVDPSRKELLRVVEVVSGRVALDVEVAPRGGAAVRKSGRTLSLLAPRFPDLDLALVSSVPLAGTSTTLDLVEGDRVTLSLRWDGGSARRALKPPEERLTETIAAWRRWAKHLDFSGPQEALVHRSALTLKMLDYIPNGSIVAAATSSLPEKIGGQRNWDYRYSWVRDAAFSVYALSRIGYPHEGHGFVAWILDVVESGTPNVLYTLDGGLPAAERHDQELEGYRRSRPVRWGNAAAHQSQHDVYGEILDCAYQWARAGGEIDAELWDRLRALADVAADRWGERDHGIWEVRTAGRPFTYSTAMCHVAVDRAARLAAATGHDGDVERWCKSATKIRDAILKRAWDEERRALVEHLGPGGLDASLLALPLRRVLEARHPKMVDTVTAITRHLGAGDGLLYRYLPQESPDGVAGDEAAFLLCSFWLADNLVLQERVEEGAELFESLCRRTNTLGLLPEQIDATSGAFLGNFPQAFSHVGLISTAVNLARSTGRRT